MKDILGVTDLATAGPAYFQNWTVATQCVLEKMTEEERSQLEGLVEARKIDRNPLDVQQV